MSVQPAITLQQQQSQPPPPSQQQPDSNANLIGGNSNINSSSSSQTGGGLFLQPTLGQVQNQPQSYYIVQQQSSSSSAINQPSQMTVLKQPTVIFNQQQPQQQQQQQQQTVTNYQIVQPQSQSQPQQQMMSNGQTMIIQPNIKYVSNGQLIQQQPQQQSQQQPQSPRIIMQHPQQQTTYIMPQTQNNQQQQPQQQQQINGGGNQFYLNINNRIVPIQSLNIKPTSSVNIQPSIQQQQQPQQQQQQTQQQQQYFIVSNNNAANSQSGVQLNQVVANTQNSSNQIQGMIQSPTIITNKPTTTTTTTTSNPVTSTLITSSGTTTTNSINSNSSSVGVEIAEKMKQLEQVQSQLRQFQTKIVSQLNLNNGEQQPQQLVLTQQQIQSVLSPAEQSTLARLIQQKKQFEAEVQTLKHKLLMSSSSSSTSSTSSSSLAVNSTTNLDTQSNSSSQPMSKMQLLQQVTLKLNQLRASKTVTNGTTSDGSQPQQQLVLTAEEFEQMKRLVELQSRLHAEIQQQQQQQQQQQESTTNTTTTTTTPQPQTIKLNELNLAEKLKLNELIKNQLEQIKQALTQLAANNNPEQSALVAQQQHQLKDKYVVLLKKQGELQALIQQQQQQQQQQAKIGGQNILFQTSSESPTYQILVNGNKPSQAQQQLTPTTTPNKQTPVKIRNVISSSPLSTTTTTTTGQPLRTLVLNANTNIVTTPSSNGLLVPQQQLIYPLSYAQNLQKLPQFASVQFKRLSFVELAQHGVITKNTDELAMLIIKQLDERAASLIGPEASSEQADAFAKNQVRLVKKYLEQQLAVRHAVRTRIHEQLVKDQKLALEPDYKTPFVDKTDAIKRLSRFHVFQKTLYEPTEEEGKKFDECFEQVSDRLLKTANAMKKRFHLFQLRSMQKDVAPSEETMMLRLLVDDLKASQEEVKQQQQQQQQQPQPQPQPQPQSNTYPQKATTNESINNDFVILNSTNLGLKRPLNEHNNNNDTSSSVSNTNGIDHESSMVKKIARLEPNAAVTPKSDANTTDKVEFDLGDRDEDEENSLKNSKQLIASSAVTTNSSDLFSLSDYNTDTSEPNAKISASTVTLPPSNSNHIDLVNQPPSTNNFINYDFNDVQAPNRTASNTNTMIHPTTTTTTAEEDEDANVMNNLSGLDDLILNEDELAVNCDSMFD